MSIYVYVYIYIYIITITTIIINIIIIVYIYIYIIIIIIFHIPYVYDEFVYRAPAGMIICYYIISWHIRQYN